MSAFKVYRIATFVSTWVFAVIVLGIAGHLQRIINLAANSEESAFNIFNDLAPVSTRLAVATATITVVFIPLLAFADIVILEWVWTFAVEALWLSTASYASRHQPSEDAYKPEYRALEAFSHMSWILVVLYNIVLLGLAITATVKGNKSVWTSRVNRTDFLSRKVPSSSGARAAEEKLQSSASSAV